MLFQLQELAISVWGYIGILQISTSTEQLQLRSRATRMYAETLYRATRMYAETLYRDLCCQ